VLRVYRRQTARPAEDVTFQPGFRAVGYSANFFDQLNSLWQSNGHKDNTSDIFYFFSVSPALAESG
jgi:hypothetical protein